MENSCQISMRKGLKRLLVGLTIPLAMNAQAVQAEKISATSGTNVTPVVELYTSEGCSSCPPADRWISKLGDSLGDSLQAVPLAFHVDYWNQLGWPDPFSRSAFTDRQRQLAAYNQQRSIYTPEFLVSGLETRGTTAVVDAIRQANTMLAKAMISLDIRVGAENTLEADALVDCDVPGAALYLAVFENDIVREIGAGENSGRTLHYDFVVRHWQEVKQLPEGQYQGAHRIPVGEDWNVNNIGLAAVVLDRDSGATLQALSTPLRSIFGS